MLSVAQSAPTVDSLHAIVAGASSQVFAANGTRLGFIQSDELRSPIGWSEIPANLKNATVAIEDQRFYKDNGVDPTGIFRAAVKDITSGEALQGGSTITMQLMRNIYLGGDQHTLRQKITEAKLALEYEKHHSKPSILTSYLNSVPYGTRRRADRDRRAGGVADLLRQTGLAARPRAGRAARGPAAGALGIQPLPRPRRRAGTAQRGAREDGRTALRHRRAGRRRRARAAGAANTATSTPKNAKASSSNTSASS